MNDDSRKLMENIMGMLGDNPAETLGEMLSAFSQKTEKAEEDNETKTDGLDPTMLLKIQNVMSKLNSNEVDERRALLIAIKPFLSEEKQGQIDQAIRFLKLSELAKTAQELDLFKGLI